MTEQRDQEEQQLEALGEHLRVQDAASAPSFDRTWAAAQVLAQRRRSAKRTRLVLAVGTATALAAAAAITLATIEVEPPAPFALTGVVEPEPLGFLLARPGGTP